MKVLHDRYVDGDADTDNWDFCQDLCLGTVPRAPQDDELVSVCNAEEAARWARESITTPVLQGDQ